MIEMSMVELGKLLFVAARAARRAAHCTEMGELLAKAARMAANEAEACRLTTAVGFFSRTAAIAAVAAAGAARRAFRVDRTRDDDARRVALLVMREACRAGQTMRAAQCTYAVTLRTASARSN